MDYTGSQSEKAVTAGELGRSHIGQTISFQPNEFTVVFGKLAGIARTEAMVYISLAGVGNGTHLKDEYDPPIDKHVYLQLDPLGSAEKGLTDAASFVKDKLDEITRNIREREHEKSE